jgi:hypothetical protein
MFGATGFNQQDIVKDGLVLWLDANDKTSYPGEGTVWRDLSRSYNIGTLTNGPTFNSANGGSIVFDGVDDYITGSNSSNFAFGTGNFTVSHWMYINAFSGNGVPTFVDLRTTGTGTGPGYSDYIEVNKFKLYLNNATVYTSTGSLSIGNWYNISVTRQSTTLSVYFNGILDGTSSNNTNLTENGFRLARNVNQSGTSYLNGRMASVLIYKGKALTASEVLQNYNANKNRFGL